MKEKKQIKISFGMVVCLVIIFILSLTVVYLYVDNKNNVEDGNIINNTSSIEQEENRVNNEETINVELGEYIITGMVVAPDYNYGIERVILEENNKCTINSPYNLFYECTYEIKENKLICKSLKEIISDDFGEESKDVEIIFEFEIIENGTLKFVNVSDEAWNVTLNMSYVQEEKNEVKGIWNVKKALKNSNEEVGLREIYGSSVSLGIGSLVLDEFYTFSDTIAPVTSIETSTAGYYKIYDNKITLTYDDGTENELIYNPNDGTIEMEVYDEYILILEKESN